MTYLKNLEYLRRAELAERARKFVNDSYNPDLPTIVILPGGMGSRLQRSPSKYDPVAISPAEEFYELWADPVLIVLGKLRQLRMNRYDEEADHHPIIAAGELTNVVKSYDGVFDWFEDKANVIGMGYDWRRTPQFESGYLRIFLQRIVEQVALKFPSAPDPRKRLTLYAHSQGGLVAKLFVESLIAMGENPLDWFERVVTCCTPFYGTNSHFGRYYVGEPRINFFTGFADNVSKIVATFPGTYILLPAPREVMLPRLEALGLGEYPVRDRANNTECDPFDESENIVSRYRPQMSRRHLQVAKEQFKILDRKLPDEVAARVFHVRSDASADGAKQDLQICWKKVKGDTYQASRGNPISDNSGRGDTTTPLWSAALPDTPPENVFDIVGVKHEGAAEHPCALEYLDALVTGAPMPVGPSIAAADFDYAPPERLEEIAQRLKLAPPEEAPAILEALTPGEYRAFVASLSLSA